MAQNPSDLVDLLIINGDLVLDEHGLPQLIGGRDVVAQDIGHRLEDSGIVFLLIGERNQNSIKSLLLSIRLEVEKDKRVIPGTVETRFDTRAEVGTLQISAKTKVGDVSIAVPVIPERYKPVPDIDQPPKVILSIPIDLGNADLTKQNVIDLGRADYTVQNIVDLGNASFDLSTEGVVILENDS